MHKNVFMAIWALVTNAFSAKLVAGMMGRNGYIDGRCVPKHPITKGVDEAGRRFITLCLRGVSSKTEDHRGVVTIFQRYTDDNGRTIAQGVNKGNVNFLTGAAGVAELECLLELVTTGTTVMQRNPDTQWAETIIWQVIDPVEAMKEIEYV